MPMQPLPAQRSRMPCGGTVSQGSKRFSIISAMGERGISTRSSTSKVRPQNQASPVR